MEEIYIKSTKNPCEEIPLSDEYNYNVSWQIELELPLSVYLESEKPKINWSEEGF